jgi:hypothetical protein
MSGSGPELITFQAESGVINKSLQKKGGRSIRSNRHQNHKKTWFFLHLRHILGLCRTVDLRALRPKAEHRVPLLVPVLFSWFCCRFFSQETFNRVPATGAGTVLKLSAVIAGRDLGWQQGGKVALPERCVNPTGFEETLDVPCRVFHSKDMGVLFTYDSCLMQIMKPGPLQTEMMVTGEMPGE